MALQELPLPVVHLAQGSSREEKRSVALALLLVFTPLMSFARVQCCLKHPSVSNRKQARRRCRAPASRNHSVLNHQKEAMWSRMAHSTLHKALRPSFLVASHWAVLLEELAELPDACRSALFLVPSDTSSLDRTVSGKKILRPLHAAPSSNTRPHFCCDAPCVACANSIWGQILASKRTEN